MISSDCRCREESVTFLHALKLFLYFEQGEQMSIAVTAQGAEAQLIESALSGLIKDIPIPPRPIVVQHMQEEMAKPDPDMR